ncbi:TMCO4 [Symbiodinium necroappetens]|uniref:TMCO4 protein n=1 Tax=Symbiodinium necroappetens TaxID=1628268 RepID=A0A812UKH2_9DINO|nr:TMCO4 [Symbiodinium necroappetens]
MDGFSDADFDALWRYFEQTCGVYLKKHRPVAALSEADFDLAMRSIEDAADRVDEASAGSVQKKAKEADLMKKVESVRDGLDQAVSGDKQALSRVFADRGCERIGRLRLVVDTVQLEVYHTDPRWKHLLSKCSTIEAVLKELGAFRPWKPSQGSGHSESLLRRAMVKELRHRHGEADDLPEEEPPATGGYAAAKQVEEPGAPYVTQPLPEPEPASTGLPHAPLIRSEQEESEEEQEPLYEEVAASKVHAAQAAQAKKFEDEEVTDPNSVRASAPDDCYDDETSRRLRYTHPDSVLEGWVWKRSRFLKRWRRRWLVLLPSGLRSFKYRGHKEPTESVQNGSVMRVYSADGEVQQARCFCVVVRERNYYMVCDDETQKRAWMLEIEKVLCHR